MMIVQDNSIMGRICCEVENEMYFDADYVDLEVDLWEFTGTLRHEIGGHSKTHNFEIELLDTSDEGGDGYFIEGETDQSGQEIIIDTGLGEYSVGGTSFDVDNNTFLTAEFEELGVELGVSPDHYDCVLVDKRGLHYDSVRFDVAEVEWDPTVGESMETRIDGTTEDGNEIRIEPENAFYEITETHDCETFGPDTQIVVGGTSVGNTWESSVDNSATEPREPIGTVGYKSDDGETVEVNTFTGELSIDSKSVEPAKCEVTFGPEDVAENTVTTCDDPELRVVDAESEPNVISDNTIWDDTEPETMAEDAENSEQAESSDESESEELDGEDVSFRDDVVYEPY